MRICVGGAIPRLLVVVVNLLLRLSALVSVKNLMFWLACNVWAVRCTALLCRAILRPFKYACSHGSIHNWGTTYGTKESRTMSYWMSKFMYKIST